VILRRRLSRRHVEGGAGDPAGGQRLGERLFVDQAATGGIDEERPGVPSTRIRPTDHVLRRRQQRRVPA